MLCQIQYYRFSSKSKVIGFLSFDGLDDIILCDDMPIAGSILSHDGRYLAIKVSADGLYTHIQRNMRQRVIHDRLHTFFKVGDRVFEHLTQYPGFCHRPYKMSDISDRER